MNADPHLFEFPELSDEAAAALNDFLEQFYTHFQNHYFAQLRRYDEDPSRPEHDADQMPLPLSGPVHDPPF